MFFTQEDIQKISKGLAELSIKDTQLPGTEEVLEQDCLAIVQDGKNKKVSVRDFLNNLGVLKKSDFINISALTDNTYNNIDEVVHEVPVNCRKPGLCVTFQDTDYNWKIYQFRGEANQWDVLTFWVDILDYSSYVVNGILPDEEDLTVSGKDEKDNLLLSLKDRKPSEDFVGKGYKILRRNIVKKQVTKTGILINKAATTTGTVGITISGITTMITLTTSDNTVEAVAKTIYDALIDNEKMSGFYVTYESNTVFVENKFTLNSSISTVGKTSSGAEIYVNDEDIEVDKNILTQAAINQPNTIYEIRYDFDLYGAEIVIPEDCVLKFEGGSFKNGTLIGSNTTIDAYSYIFRNIMIKGTYINDFYVEWWGAHSSKSNNEIYINSAIKSLGVSSLSITADERIDRILILRGCYEITNTIYLNSYVSLIGSGTFSRSRWANTQSTIIVNFKESNKWIIDISYKDGTTIPYNKLYMENGDNLYNANTAINISNLHIKYKKGSSKVFGGIRAAYTIHSKFTNIDISAPVQVGIAIIYGGWNMEFKNILIYANNCGLYLGKLVTTVTLNNVYLLHENIGLSSTLEILNTTKPPYLENLPSACCIFENAHATFYGCIFQGFESLIIGTDYTAYFSSPYIEQITVTYIWLYATHTIQTDLYRYQVVVNNMQLGNYDTSSYSLGTIRGVIEVHNFMNAKCYTPTTESWNYPSYFIYSNDATANYSTLYYDDYKVNDSYNIIQAIKSPYKKFINKIEPSKYQDIYVIPERTPQPPFVYLNTTLRTGFSEYAATTVSEVIKRKYNKVSIHPVVNNTPIISNGIYFEYSDIIWETLQKMSHQALFKESLNLYNSKITYKDNLTDGSSNFISTTQDNNSKAYHKVKGLNNVIQVFGKWNISNFPWLELVGEEPIKVEITLRGSFISEKVFVKKENLIYNPEFSYPYEIIVYIENDVNNKKARYYYSNNVFPKNGLYKSLEYINEENTKYIWDGTQWLNPDGSSIDKVTIL